MQNASSNTAADLNDGFRRTPLTPETQAQALALLSQRDPQLARIIGEFGAPPFWVREPGFATLVLIILEQQVSLASARAAFNRLSAIVAPLTPAGLLALDDATLKTVGFSRQKMRYSRLLAEALVDGSLRLETLSRLDDDEVRVALQRIKGIGRWTADVYLLMALRRPDIWPVGDLALALALQRLRGLERRPAPAELEQLSGLWQPWRAVAARILWHYYLSSRASGRPAQAPPAAGS